MAEGLRSATHEGVQRHSVLAYSWDVLDKLRRHFSPRTSKCGWLPIPGQDVQLRRTRGGRGGLRAHIEGLRACGSPWECPVCLVKIKAARSKEIHKALTWWAEQHGAANVALVTLTIPHQFGDDLTRLRTGMAAAWRRLQQGRAARRVLAAYGVAGAGGFIRALEVTDGPNGWHPHLHFLILSIKPITPKCRRVRERWRCPKCHQDHGEAEGRAPRCLKCDSAPFRGWLVDAWRAAVRDVLGQQSMPSRAHGVDIQVADRAAQYLAKLGMEIAAPGTKAARAGHRTYPDMLRAAAFDGDWDSWDRGRAFVKGMRGAKMLFWSRGLKRRTGVTDLTDEEVIAQADSMGEKVTQLKPDHWQLIRWLPGARVDLAEAAEDGGAVGAEEFARLVVPIARARLIHHRAKQRQRYRAA